MVGINVRDFFSEKPLGDGGGGTLPSFYNYNGQYGKTPLERGIFFRLQVYLKEKGFY